MQIFKVNYHDNKSELCDIGRKYDTDKSSQRHNISNDRHCHAYTLFYDRLFRSRKHEPLEIAELGIAEGSSILMWQEYFTTSYIYGFDVYAEKIVDFKNKYNNERITLSTINVHNNDSIKNTFAGINILYDIIIEDTTHQFEDQIRVIENTYQYLKPGGILIIEDIYKSYNEENYINRLKPILHNFQDYYFVEVDHINRNSVGWDNDKLFVLIKDGGEPIFENPLGIMQELQNE